MPAGEFPFSFFIPRNYLSRNSKMGNIVISECSPVGLEIGGKSLLQKIKRSHYLKIPGKIDICDKQARC